MHPTREDLLRIIAKREGYGDPEAVREAIYAALRKPKDNSARPYKQKQRSKASIQKAIFRKQSEIEKLKALLKGAAPCRN
jgi:hypothetical protein